MFDAGDPEAAYLAICAVLDERGVAAELRARGRVRAAAFTWHRAAEAMAAIVARQAA
jgi:glycosyltransferase involved in cell wall biosynthesis